MRKKKSEVFDVVVTMTLKKPISQSRYFPNRITMSKMACRAIHSIQDDYPEIVVDDVTVAFGVSDTIDIRLLIDRDFAFENMCINGYFEPDSFLGYYLSRVARKLKKTSKSLNRYYGSTGMFKYKFRVIGRRFV